MKTVLMAARHPLFLAVLVVAVIAGLLAEPWLFPLGLVVYAVSVGLASRDAGMLAQRAQQEKRRDLTSPTFRTKIAEIERSRDEALQALRKTGGPVARQLATIEPQTRELVDQAYTLARKGQDIEMYLARVDYHHLQDQINQIDQRIAQASDDYILNQLQSTRQERVSQLEAAQVLETYIGRVISQLDNIDANLDSMPAHFARMRASDVDASIASSEVARNLDSLNADMHAFVGMLDTALNQTRPLASQAH